MPTPARIWGLIQADELGYIVHNAPLSLDGETIACGHLVDEHCHCQPAREFNPYGVLIFTHKHIN